MASGHRRPHEGRPTGRPPYLHPMIETPTGEPMAILKCPNCGQTYDTRYMLYCARCGEALPNERGKLPPKGPYDGMGSRGGWSPGKARPGAPVAAAETSAAESWEPSDAVKDMVLGYRNQLNETPEDHTTRYSLALAYLYARRFDLAEQELLQVLQAMPDYADAWERLVFIQARLGKVQEAQASAHRALEIAPNNDQLRQWLRELEEWLEAAAQSDE